MTDDTQNRLKAFLARNRSRITGPGADTSDISNAYFSGSSTKTDTEKLDMIQNISQTTKFPENSNKTLAQSLDEKRSGREFEGVSFEYQPISLFDVIGNTPYGEAHDSTITRNNSILQSEHFRNQGSDLFSIVNTSPGRQTDRNAEYESQLTSGKKNQNNVILNEEYNAMANTNKPASVSKSSKADAAPTKKTSPAKDGKKETLSSPRATKTQSNSQVVKDIKPQGTPNSNKIEPEKPQHQQQQLQQQNPLPVIEKVEEIKGRTGSMSFNGSIKGGSQTFEEAEPGVDYQPPKENKIVEPERRYNSPESEKKKSRSPPKKVKEEEGIVNNEDNQGKVKGVFSESSKKLNALNENTPNDSEFKKEIKNLIKVIKQEKEQVVGELKLMAEDLNKYKSAFKKLQKQKGTKQTDPVVGSPKRDSVGSKKGTSPERQGSGGKSNRVPSPQKSPGDKVGFENIQGLDLKGLMSEHELKKDSINEFVIKDMNLNPKLFFKDDERLETDPNIKPTIVDLVGAQREIINFLVKRYQTAEHNRLKTEEQASKVVLSLESTVKKLEKKDSLSRTRSSLSPINSRRRVNMTDQ